MTVAARRIEAPPLAPLDQVDEVARRMLPALRSMVRAEVEHLKVPAPRVRISKVDAELMEACRKVAAAVDRLEQAKFAGQGEIGARVSLGKAAARLRNVMKRHGRMQ